MGLGWGRDERDVLVTLGLKLERSDLRSMVDDFFFFELFADALEFAHFFPAVELDVVGAEFGKFAKPAADEGSEFVGGGFFSVF